MVTKRKIGFILLFILSAFVFIWNFSSISDVLKQKIIEDIYKASKGTVLLEAKDVGLGPGYVSIDSVSVKNENPNSQFYLSINRVKIYFRVWPLFLFKTSLPELLTGVVLEKPEFIVYLKKRNAAYSGEEGKSNFIKLEQFFRLNEHLPSFKLKDADFSIYKNNQKWFSFTDLNGALHKEKDGTIHASISDQEAHDSTINITIDYQPDSGLVLNHIEFNDFSVQKIQVLQLDNPIRIKEGILYGEFDIFAEVNRFNQFEMDGQLTCRTVSGEIYQKFFSCDSIRLNLKKDKFVIEASPLLFGSSEINWTLDGEILPELKTHGFFYSDDFDLSTLNFYLPEQDSLRGSVRLTGIFNYDSQTFLKTSFFSDRIYYQNWSQENVTGNAVLSDSVLHINLNTSNHIYQFTSTLDYNLTTQEMNGALNGKYLISSNVPLLTGLDSSWVELQSYFGGDLSSRAVRGTVELNVKDKRLSQFSPMGQFSYENHQINFNLVDTTWTPPLSLNIEISDLDKKPLVNILELYNFPLETFFGSEYVKYVPQDMLVSFYLAGVPEYLQGKIRLFSRRTGDEWLEFSGKAENFFTRYASLNGDLSIYTHNREIKGRTFIASQPKRWHGFFYLGDFLKTDIQFDFQGTDPYINLSANLDNLKITTLIPAVDSLKWNGTFNSHIKLQGPLSNPEGSIKVDLQDIILNGVGYIDLDVEGHFLNNQLIMDSIFAQLNNVPIVQGHLMADFSSYEISGRLQGAGVELYNFSEMIFGNRELLKGNTNFDIQFIPTDHYPKLDIKADVFDAEILNEKISELHIQATDSLADWNPFSKKVHQFNFHQLSWVSSLGYRGWAEGRLSFVPTVESNLNVHLVGNVLAHLGRFIPFFKKIDVDGDVRASIVGSPENLSLGDFEIEITDGNIEFERVLKPLHQLRAYITKDKNAPFVRIHRIEGFFENSFAHIHNVESVTLADGRTLSPWYFDGLKLNFGTLVLQTVPTGIPLNIPGMQEPGDFGYFAVKGMNPGEEFYFSGPIDHPVVRGTVIGRNARVTFPFLETEGSDPDNPGKVVEFLMGINWDVKAVADKGMYYFVEIPAYVGKVYMELNVDINSPGLHFTGTLNDESFRVEGEVFSYKGDVEYLETNFRVEKFGAVFNKLELFPEVYGRAFTTVRDSLNIPHEIYLQLYAIDPETKQEVQRGRWEDFRFKLVSNEPVIGDNQELVLAQMGYSVQNLSSKVTEVGSQLTENLLIRPLVRPLERFLEKRLNLDYVRFRSAVAKNLMNYSLGSQFKWWNRENSLNLYNPYLSPDPTLILLQSSELTLGKYLERNLYLSYTMQLMAMYESVDLHLNQRINLEYRLMNNFLLEFEYDYFKYNQYRFLDYDKPYDFIIRLRHSFNF